MKIQKINYLGGFKQSDSPDEVREGSIELKLLNGRTLQIPAAEVEAIIVHNHLEDE